MKFILLLLIAALCPCSAFAQPLKINEKQLELAKNQEAKAKADGDSAMIAQAYYLYGRAYSFAGDNLRAKRFYVRALNILKNRPPSYELGHIYVRLCEVLNIKRPSNQDTDYLYRAIDIFEKLNSSQGLAMAYGMLQGCYGMRWVDGLEKGTSRFDSLVGISEMELKHAKIARDTSFIVDALVRFGGTYHNVDDTEKSLEYLGKALHFANMTKNDTIRIRALLGFSDTHLHSHKPDLARPYIEEVEKTYKRNGYQQFFILIHYLQSWKHYYQEKGDWKRAFEQLDVIDKLLTSTDLANYDKTISAMDHELGEQKAALMLDAQRKENRLTTLLLRAQQRFIIISVTLLTLTTILSIFFFRLYRKFQRISRENAQISHRNEQLVREQNHRVKNNLQMVSSLLSMQARQLTDNEAKQAILESKLRVQTMAIIQRRLYDSTHLTDINLAEFVPELAADVLTACGFARIGTIFEIDPIFLDVDRAIPIGLMITELIVNSSKYAFPENSTPRLTIRCKKLDRQITLQLMDNGVEESDCSESNVISRERLRSGTSFGTQLISLLARQLYGDHHYVYQSDATEFNLKFNA